MAVPVNLALAAIGLFPCLATVLLLTLLAGELGWTTDTHGTYDTVALGVITVGVTWAAYLPPVVAANLVIRRRSRLGGRTYWGVVLPVLALPWLAYAVDTIARWAF